MVTTERDQRESFGTPIQEAFRREILMVAGALQTLAWLVAKMPQREARKTLRAAAAGIDPRIVSIVDCFVARRE